MRFSNHIIDCERGSAAASRVLRGAYPIGFTLEQFLHLFADAKSIYINAIYMTTSANNAFFGSITEFLSMDPNTTTINTIAGLSRRRTYPIGFLENNGSDQIQSHRPTALTYFPFHTTGSGGGYLTIDFGRTLLYAGLFFPYIEISFAEGAGSLATGNIIGSVSFDPYGSIAIYDSPSASPLNFTVALGRIEIREFFSFLRSSRRTFQVGEQIQLDSVGGSLSDLRYYTSAFFGNIKVPIFPSDDSISITIPQGAKSGPILLARDEPHYDKFLSYDEFTIS